MSRIANRARYFPPNRLTSNIAMPPAGPSPMRSSFPVALRRREGSFHVSANQPFVCKKAVQQDDDRANNKADEGGLKDAGFTFLFGLYGLGAARLLRRLGWGGSPRDDRDRARRALGRRLSRFRGVGRCLPRRRRADGVGGIGRLRWRRAADSGRRPPSGGWSVSCGGLGGRHRRPRAGSCGMRVGWRGTGRRPHPAFPRPPRRASQPRRFDGQSPVGLSGLPRARRRTDRDHRGALAAVDLFAYLDGRAAL